MRISVVVLVLALGSCLSSCASDGTARDGSSATPTTAEEPVVPPELSDPPVVDPPASGKPARPTRVQGVVVEGVEAGCLLLEAGGETLLLLGVAPGRAAVGARVEVTGTRAPGLMTTCQQGVPFQVSSIQPAE